jgi:hypothetical protein
MRKRLHNHSLKLEGWPGADKNRPDPGSLPVLEILSQHLHPVTSPITDQDWQEKEPLLQENGRGILH